MKTDTKQLAVYVLRWLDRHGLGDTDLREVMDLVANYDCSLERALQMVNQMNENTKKVMEND